MAGRRMSAETSSTTADPGEFAVEFEDDEKPEADAEDQRPRIVVRLAASRSARPAAAAASQEPRYCWPPCECWPPCQAAGCRSCPPPSCWFVRDPCGAACVAVAWLLLLFAEFVVVFVILIPAPSAAFKWIGGVIFHLLLCLSLAAHLRAIFSDPGAVPLNNATKENIVRLGATRPDRVVYKCPRCGCLKPNRTHHCSVCRRCIRRMDHHCPWVNNCVGEANQKFFVLFTGYIAVTSFFAIYLCGHYFVMCLGSEWEACHLGPSPPISSLLLFALIITGLVFGLFTIVMSCSQLAAILSDTTGIENLKGERRDADSRSRIASLASIFGQPLSWRWLSPFHSPTPAEEEEE